jgi:hypothetical protein
MVLTDKDMKSFFYKLRKIRLEFISLTKKILRFIVLKKIFRKGRIVEEVHRIKKV